MYIQPVYIYLFFNFYNVVLVSAKQQCESAIITRLTIPPSPPHPIPPGHHRAQAGIRLLHSIFSPAVRHTPDSVYMLILLSPYVPFSSAPTMSTSPFSISASPFLP